METVKDIQRAIMEADMQQTGNLAQRIADVSRKLTNPGMRVAMRPDFPMVESVKQMTETCEMIKRELAKQNLTLEDVGHISVAYPHKHPGLFPGYSDQAFNTLWQFIKSAQREMPQVEWIPAHAICETVHLDRSNPKNRGAIYGLTSKQAYDVYAPAQKTPLPFLDPANTKKEMFVIVDWCVDQGTTVNNLRSFIEHNGGHVLGAISRDASDLRQTPGFAPMVMLDRQFNDKAKNTARLAALGQAFSRSTSTNPLALRMSANHCLREFEKALNAVGNTVFSLTDGECKTLEREDFRNLIRGLKAVAKSTP